MSKSLIYAVNTNSQQVADGGIARLNSVIRRYGSACQMAEGGVKIGEAGYYTVDANISFTSGGTGTVTVDVLKDGVPIPGATALHTVSANTYCIVIPCVVREYCSCNGPGLITIRISGAATTVTNVALLVERS